MLTFCRATIITKLCHSSMNWHMDAALCPSPVLWLLWISCFVVWSCQGRVETMSWFRKAVKYVLGSSSKTQPLWSKRIVLFMYSIKKYSLLSFSRKVINRVIELILLLLLYILYFPAFCFYLSCFQYNVIFFAPSLLPEPWLSKIKVSQRGNISKYHWAPQFSGYFSLLWCPKLLNERIAEILLKYFLV